MDELSDIVDALETDNKRMTLYAAAQTVFMKTNGLELSAAAEKTVVSQVVV